MPDMRLLVELYIFCNSFAVYENKICKDMSFLTINLIFRCCNDKALDADDNVVKTVNLFVKSLSGNCELSDIFVFK